MWEISECDIKLSLCHEINATKKSRKYCSSLHYSLKVLALFILALFALHVIITTCICDFVYKLSITHLLDLEIPDSKLIS